jgi:hypothetical protein
MGRESRTRGQTAKGHMASVYRQGEFKNTINIFLQKVHVENFPQKNRKFFDVSFSSIFVLSRFGVFLSDGSSKTAGDKRMCMVEMSHSAPALMSLNGYTLRENSTAPSYPSLEQSAEHTAAVADQQPRHPMGLMAGTARHQPHVSQVAVRRYADEAGVEHEEGHATTDIRLPVGSAQLFPRGRCNWSECRAGRNGKLKKSLKVGCSSAQCRRYCSVEHWQADHTAVVEDAGVGPSS